MSQHNTREINTQYAHERIKQIDQMITEINARIDDAINNAKHHTNKRARKLEHRKVEQYEFKMMHLRAQRAALSRALQRKTQRMETNDDNTPKIRKVV